MPKYVMPCNRKGAPLGPDGVEVLHFYDLYERLTGEKVLHENQDMDYNDIVMEDASVQACDH